MSNSRSIQRGFTLLEVVVAMSIFVIGILATVQMGFFAVRNVTSGNIVTQATLLAQSRMEQIKNTENLRGKNETGLADNFPAESDVVPQSGNGQPIVGGALFDISYAFADPLADDTGDGVNCEDGSDTSGSGTCLAVVTVTWQRGGGGRGGQGQVEMHTLTHGSGI